MESLECLTLVAVLYDLVERPFSMGKGDLQAANNSLHFLGARPLQEGIVNNLSAILCGLKPMQLRSGCTAVLLSNAVLPSRCFKLNRVTYQVTQMNLFNCVLVDENVSQAT